jgi:uncharacterized membrane protein
MFFFVSICSRDFFEFENDFSVNQSSIKFDERINESLSKSKSQKLLINSTALLKLYYVNFIICKNMTVSLIVSILSNEKRIKYFK